LSEKTHEKTKKNLEELLLYYQVEKIRLEIEWLKNRSHWYSERYRLSRVPVPPTAGSEPRIPH
jgi:hypothetical protein